nr:MAG TPA: hypothetical protein [Caudoviricetes sp.]
MFELPLFLYGGFYFVFEGNFRFRVTIFLLFVALTPLNRCSFFVV